MTLSGHPAMGSSIPPMPVMQQHQQPASYGAAPMLPAQQQPHVPNQQVPGFSMHPAAPQAPPQQVPQFTQPPADSALSLRISKLAEYTSRNGPAFEEQVRAKQAHNPEYAFLQGGEGSSFYQWCLFCFMKGIPFDQPPAESMSAVGARGIQTPAPAAGLPPRPTHPHAVPMQPPQQQAPSPMSQTGVPGSAPAGPHGGATGIPPGVQPTGPMPPDVASGFAHVLHVLQGSQDFSHGLETAACVEVSINQLLQESIKSSSAWFLACRQHAAGMVDMMLHKVQQVPDFHAQLHVIYLINDLFFTAKGETPPGDAGLRAVFKPHIPAFFTAAYSTAACSQDAFGQLCSLLDLWSNREVMDVATVINTRARMLDVGPPVPVPIPVPPAQQPIPGGVQMPPPGGMPPGPDGWAPHGPGPNAMPPPMRPMAGPPHPVPFMAQHSPAAHSFPGTWRPPVGGPGVHAQGPPGPAIVPAPPPEKEPYDILSFPAGLIPKYEKEYMPLRQDDIDSEPPPPRPAHGGYLQGRLQRFYAELAQYTPGVPRAAYEERLATLGDGLLPPAPDPALKTTEITASKETNMNNDGSFAGRGDAGRSGLGANDTSSGDGDLYDHYRRQRSGRYHSIMASKSTNPNRPPQGH